MAQQDTDVDMTDTQSQRESFSVVDVFERKVKCTLTPDEIVRLNELPSQVFVCGPPGTGKTLVLQRQGIMWLKGGHDVHVVSVSDSSLAATVYIEDQLKKVVETLSTNPRPIVTRHSFQISQLDGNARDVALRTLTQAALRKNQLCVLIDEADYDRIGIRHYFEEFFNTLKRDLMPPTTLCLCMAATRHDVRPTGLTEIKLTKPLRSTNIVRKVMEAEEIRRGSVYHYTDIPDLTEVQNVKYVNHENHATYQNHPNIVLPEWCIDCGREVAGLLNELKESREFSPPLRYCDILFLHVKETEIRGMSLENGFVKGLRDMGVPVRVVKRSDVDAIKQTTNEVIVTHCDNVRGLERKVVVVPNKGRDSSWDEYELRWLSRCTEQLIILNWYPPGRVDLPR